MSAPFSLEHTDITASSVGSHEMTLDPILRFVPDETHAILERVFTAPENRCTLENLETYRNCEYRLSPTTRF